MGTSHPTVHGFGSRDPKLFVIATHRRLQRHTWHATWSQQRGSSSTTPCSFDLNYCTIKGIPAEAGALQLQKQDQSSQETSGHTHTHTHPLTRGGSSSIIETSESSSAQSTAFCLSYYFYFKAPIKPAENTAVLYMLKSRIWNKKKEYRLKSKPCLP